MDIRNTRGTKKKRPSRQKGNNNLLTENTKTMLVYKKAYQRSAHHYETNGKPSMTVPNQAMTVRELIIRFASGIPLDAGKVPIYEGELDLPDLDKMDLIEREAYYKELRQQRDEVELRVKNARIKREEMKMEEVIQERIRKAQEEKDRAEFEEFKKLKSNSNGN